MTFCDVTKVCNGIICNKESYLRDFHMDAIHGAMHGAMHGAKALQKYMNWQIYTTAFQDHWFEQLTTEYLLH